MYVHVNYHDVWYYVIVKAQLPGIYGSKLTESEGIARGRGWFTLS